jgi:hypothetical protein
MLMENAVVQLIIGIAYTVIVYRVLKHLKGHHDSDARIVRRLMRTFALSGFSMLLFFLSVAIAAPLVFSSFCES